MTTRVLVLRLTGPLQAWGSASLFNRRETDLWPSKSGIVGLLAAAQGRRRTDPIEDLLSLSLGVRIDQAGSVLRDYHTVSTLDGEPLLSASINAKGQQRPNSAKKTTAVTERFYLQDALFVAAVEGPPDLIEGLAYAVSHPTFPLYLGRRSCAPGRPPLVRDGDAGTWDPDVRRVLRTVPWLGRPARPGRVPATLPVVFDFDPEIDPPERAEERADVPVSFAPTERAWTTRRVIADWVSPPGLATDENGTAPTDCNPPQGDDSSVVFAPATFNDFDLVE